MRVSSVTSPALLSGTLKSTRTNRRLSRRAMSRSVALGIPPLLSAAPVLRNLFASIGQIVNQNIVADVIWRCKEGPTAVNLGEFRDKAFHVIVLAQHKRIDGNTLTCTALHLLEGLQERALRGGVFEANLAVADVRRRLAI